MDQPTFGDLEYTHKKHRTRREKFLERLEGLVPWQRLEARIEPHYPKAGPGASTLWGRRRRPYALSVMLRVHLVQLCYNLSDPGMEDLLYEAESVRRFVGVRLSEPLPDESTILHFRHLLERHHLGQELFAEINGHLAAQGVRLQEGTIVDATIIAGADLYQEPERAAGRGNASGEEGEPVLLWDETAHRSGRGHGGGAQLCNDAGQRARRDASAPAAAR